MVSTARAEFQDLGAAMGTHFKLIERRTYVIVRYGGIEFEWNERKEIRGLER